MRYTTEIRGDEMKMLGRREGGDAPMRGGDSGGYEAPPAPRQAPARQEPAAPAGKSSNSGFGDFDDDIPF